MQNQSALQHNIIWSFYAGLGHFKIQKIITSLIIGITFIHGIILIKKMRRSFQRLILLIFYIILTLVEPSFLSE